MTTNEAITILEEISLIDDSLYQYNEKYLEALEMAIQSLSAENTAELQPIIHGKWLKSDIPDSVLSKCSVCGFDCGAYTFKYCPMCGAKMEE